MTSSASRRLHEVVPTEYREPESQSSNPAPRRDAPPETQYLAGDVIGDRYRLVRKLGEGGMGVVWVAHSLVLGVDIALKLIRASAAGPGLSSRMAREAHAAARLGHPALVRVFDFGWTTRGDPFLVMELAQGETLSTLLHRENRMGAIRSVQMLLPLADGLRCAHEKGIVHRDIKPENVFIAADPLGRLQPKLLDFGIAKMDQQPNDGRLTQMGAILGSPEFMSPEQALGSQDIDARTDVWSMCVMLYEMITGAMPFKNKNYNALIQSIVNDDPRPSTDFSAGDAELWRVIARGLEKSVDDRWASMTELGEALALWLYEHGVKEDISGNSVRALWLDGPLPGARPEVRTGGSDRVRTPSGGQSGVPTVVASLRAFSRMKLRLLHYRRRMLRRWRSLALGLACVLAGVIVTLAFTGGRSEAPAAAPLPAVVAPVQPPPVAKIAADTPPTPTPSEPVSPSPEPPRGETKATADAAKKTTETTQRKRESGAAPRAARKTIKNFGF
jgi:serine/threonine protein kinase